MKQFFIAMVVTFSVLFGVGGAAMAASPIDGARQDVCNGVQTQVGGTCGAGAGTDISRVIRAVLQILSWIAGVVAVFMVLLSGLKYITSGGDSSGIAGAKQALIYAIVGVIIVALSQVIVRFVIGRTAA
jgi:hypothetical protein